MANPLRVTKTYKYIERKEKEKKEIRYRDTVKLIWRDYANGVCGIIFRENFFPIFGRRKSSLFFKNPAKIKRILISNNI